ncbi:MAG: hypothetical protein HS113_26845 [Verrucomicrobiales bacterium]|nr:hypothetical protein [Verrucomicrobiales bacterium]
MRRADGARLEPVAFTVERRLPAGQIAPHGLVLEATGLPGAAFLVETDGTCLFGITGFETLCTYELRPSGPHVFRGRAHLRQRVADLRVRDGYLFCVGDHGLLVFRCADLRAGRMDPVAAVAGGAFYGVDARSDPAGEADGLLVSLTEHAPRWGTNTLRVVFYQFTNEELTPLGTFRRVAGPNERQFAVALDPRHRKAYVSGWGSLNGADKYLLELTTTNLLAPVVQHREETGLLLAGDMDALDDVLWTGVATTVLGNQVFRAYTLRPGGEPLRLSRTLHGGPGAGRVARVRIVNHQVTAGSTWYGNRPDVFLFSTFGDTILPAASRNSLDWAFDVTGLARPAGTNAGKLLVADEWGGFISFDYQVTPRLRLTRQPDYQQVVAAAMTEGLHLAGDRVYVAGRGGGPWSADRHLVGDESRWRHAAFDWTQAEPQPHPISAVCTRRDPQAGMLLAALGHEKAMAWGTKILGLLYRETSSQLVLLAQAEAFDPPGLGSEGVSAVWPEPDLVYMATGSDGFRAYVVNPDLPSLTLHRDCQTSGFATHVYSTALSARCFKHHVADGRRQLIVGSTPALLVGLPTLNLFSLGYPAGVPDRHVPGRPIRVVHDATLGCTKWKPVRNLDVRPSGLTAVATSAGLAVFHLDWVPALNQMNDVTAWNRIRVPTAAYAPWWHPDWTEDVADVSFADDHTVYVVKAPDGLWRLHLQVDLTNLTQRAMATAYYPGVSCGMDYTRQLHGWANPDIPTLHHPYSVVAVGDTAWVTGWSGKVQRLAWQPDSGLRILRLHQSADRVALDFTTPFGSRPYQLEAAPQLRSDGWAPVPDAVIRLTGGTTYRAECAGEAAAAPFYRLAVPP